MRKIKTNLDRQLFNDGYLKHYAVKNIADKGMMPRYDKVVINERVPFEYKTAGEKRRYYAAQYGREFDNVVKVDAHYSVSEGHVLEIDGNLYEVVSTSKIFSVYPHCLEISVRKVNNIDECIN